MENKMKIVKVTIKSRRVSEEANNNLEFNWL